MFNWRKYLVGHYKRKEKRLQDSQVPNKKTKTESDVFMSKIKAFELCTGKNNPERNGLPCICQSCVKKGKHGDCNPCDTSCNGPHSVCPAYKSRYGNCDGQFGCKCHGCKQLGTCSNCTNCKGGSKRNVGCRNRQEGVSPYIVNGCLTARMDKSFQTPQFKDVTVTAVLKVPYTATKEGVGSQVRDVLENHILNEVKTVTVTD